MRRLFAFVRFVLFVILFLAIGEGLNRVLPLIHFPDRSFTWHKIKVQVVTATGHKEPYQVVARDGYRAKGH